jgi:hypothetical protein
MKFIWLFSSVLSLQTFHSLADVVVTFTQIPSWLNCRDIHGLRDNQEYPVGLGIDRVVSTWTQNLFHS